ncbi:uncharacterized protein LOC127450422 isoform X2 [Myxocyprinus asiaticus]|uniref:uncharacterized protein LOC127450422 isoform X2 n=1 Tax=Myxocyprinus asiaticus TaxID=70543 RepID=UPI00222372E9|nr:uncharacterized protein LOC127450422 isoform X2 [Myxocyprinus asiaticus]
MGPWDCCDKPNSMFDRDWTSVLLPKIKTDKTSGWPKGVGFFRYSSTEEAEAPEAAGPPHLGGFQTDIYRVVIPKVAEADKNSPIPTLPYKHSHELGMAYKHINSRWLQ